MEKKIIELLEELIAIPSVFPNEENLAGYCADFLKGFGFKVSLLPIGKNRFNVVATKGSQKKCVMLFAHLDTVPPYGYKKNPYEMKINGDIISGLGSFDMKSGIAIILYCASKIKLKKFALKIVLSSDEENNSLGSHIIYTKTFLKNVILAITPEIIDDVNDSNDNNLVLLGRRGRVVYRLQINGISGHGAALKGISAISVASEIVRHIEKIKLKRNDFLGNATLFVREIKGASTSLSLPEICEIYVDAHYVPPYTQDTLLEEIKNSINTEYSDYISRGVAISAEILKRNTPYLKPYITDAKNKYVNKALNLASKNIKNLKISAGLTVADENIVAGFGVPVITIGPFGGEAHSSNEWVSKKSVEETEKTYIHILENF